MEFNPACRRCPRLFHYLKNLRQRFPDYHNAPVPAFGCRDAPVLIVGLAPGLHGANATARVFTGDASGDLLFTTLHRFGFSDKAVSRSCDDALQLVDCRITNAVKCVPPLNRPNRTELKRCGDYLKSEILSQRPTVVIALGKIAHDAVLRSLDCTLAKYPFSHLAEHKLGVPGVEALTLIDSYHCSRYNIQTGRLTQEMFSQVFARVRGML